MHLEKCIVARHGSINDYVKNLNAHVKGVTGYAVEYDCKKIEKVCDLNDMLRNEDWK